MYSLKNIRLTNKLFLFVFTLALSLTLFIHCQPEVFAQGERIYQSKCASCHMEEGQGLGELIPPVAASDYYLQHYDELVCNIINGMNGKIIVNGIEYEGEMLPIRSLTAAEMTNLINYMNHKWYPELQAVMMKDIQLEMDECLMKK